MAKKRKAHKRFSPSVEKTSRPKNSPDRLTGFFLQGHPARLILWVLVSVYFFLSLHFLYQRHIHFEMKEPTDSTAFMQISWSILHGTPYTVTTLEHAAEVKPYNFFSRHLTLTLSLFFPIFFFTSSGVVFLIIQALTISLAAVPLYLFAEKKLENEWLALLIAVSYLFNPGTVESFEKFGFRVETFFIPAFFAMFYFLEKNDYGKASISLLLALLTKHNIIMITFMLGVFYLTIERKHWRFGGICLILATAYYIIGVRVILGGFQTGETASMKQFASFGSTHKEAFVNMLLNPGKILASVSSQEWQYSGRIFFPPGLLALLHPVFWVCLPQLVMNAILTDYHSIYCAWHWAAVIPFLFAGAVYTMKGIMTKFDQYPHPTRSILFFILLVGLFYNLADFNKTVIDADRSYYYKQSNIDTSKIIEQLSIIEPEASVMASGQLLWFLFARNRIYTSRQKFHDEVDYIAILLPMGQRGTGNNDRHLLQEAPKRNSKYFKNFRVVSKSKNLVILRNITYRKPTGNS